jgi:hypothetical protein
MANEKKPHGNKGKKRTLEQINAKAVQTQKPVIAIDINKNEYHFNSLTEASIALNIKAPSISLLLSGRAKGYSFKYGSKS